jgi:predicted GNAT family N-acyltransferase
MPMDAGLAPCEEILRRHGTARQSQNSWEVGRLVVSPQYRTSPEALKRCLFLSLSTLMQTIEVDNLYASCTPILARLYRRFGFSVVSKDACDDAAGTFQLIHGSVPVVLHSLAATADEKALAEAGLAQAEAA